MHSGIPGDLDHARDPVTRSQEAPRLPDDISSLDEESKLEQLELSRKRQLHHSYMTVTSENDPTHCEALTLPFALGRRKVFELSSAAWQGHNIPLRSSLMLIKQQWQNIAARPEMPCPITFDEEEERECLRLDDVEQEAVEQLKGTVELLGMGAEGWVPNEDYEAVMDAIARMKDRSLEEAETELDRAAVREYWIFDDMDEDEYL